MRSFAIQRRRKGVQVFATQLGLGPTFVRIVSFANVIFFSAEYSTTRGIHDALENDKCASFCHRKLLVTRFLMKHSRCRYSFPGFYEASKIIIVEVTKLLYRSPAFKAEVVSSSMRSSMMINHYFTR